MSLERKMRRSTARRIKLPPEAVQLFEEQRRRFEEKFGRKPGETDPLFFDPDCDTPTPIAHDKLEAATLAVLKQAGTRPEIIHAYRKTGRIVTTQNVQFLSTAELAEWNAAVDEFRTLN